MNYTIEKLRQIIAEKIPQNNVVPQHTEREHFYKIMSSGLVLPSVTGALKLLKDEGLMNWKQNRSLEYVANNLRDIKDLPAVLEKAKQEPVDLFEEAGDIGSTIHHYREVYFRNWIETGVKPLDAVHYIPELEKDIRVISALRGLERFIKDHNYVPIATELYVYSEKFKLAGTLDDLGFMGGEFGDLVLIDLKSSNQLKDSYHLQVAIYYQMFKELTGIKPKKCYILRLSKIDGTYELQEIKQINKVVNGAKALFKLNQCLEMIKNNKKERLKI